MTIDEFKLSYDKNVDKIISIVDLSKKGAFLYIIKYKEALISSLAKNLGKYFLLIMKYEHNKCINNLSKSLSRFKLFNNINKYFSNLKV